jgi:hypothetical protein
MHDCYNYTGFSDKEVVVTMAENKQILVNFILSILINEQ